MGVRYIDVDGEQIPVDDVSVPVGSPAEAQVAAQVRAQKGGKPAATTKVEYINVLGKQLPVQPGLTEVQKGMIAREYMKGLPRQDTANEYPYDQPPKASVTLPPKSTAPAYSSQDLFKNSLKKGFTGIAGLGNLLLSGADKALEVVGVKPIQGGYEERKQGIEGFQTDVTGVNQTIKPRNAGEKVIAAVGEALTDPTNLLGPAKAAGQSIIGSLFKKELAAVGGAAGASAATTGLERSGVENPYVLALGGVAGGIAGGAATGVTPTALAGKAASTVIQSRRLLKEVNATQDPAEKDRIMREFMAVHNIKPGSGDAVKAQVEAAIKGVSDGRLDYLVRQAQSADPKIGDKVEDAIQVQNRLGIKLPAVAATGDNAVLRTEAANRISSSAGTAGRASNNQVVEDATEGVRRYVKDRYGDPSVLSEKVIAATDKVATTLYKNADTAAAQREGALGSINAAIAAFSGKSEVGSRVVSLIEARERLVRSELSPLYKESEELARAKNYTVSPEVTQQMADNLTSLRDAKFMTMFTGPQKAALGRLQSAAEGGEGFSYTDWETLKQGVNKMRRARLDNDTQYMVGRMWDDVVKPGREAFPTEFQDRLKAVDAQYLQRVGLELESEGMRNLSGKALHERVVPTLVGSPQTTREFLAVTGPEGKELLGEALRADLRSFVGSKADGVSPKALATWMASRKDVLDQHPELKTEIGAMHGKSATLAEASAEAELRHQKFISEDLLGRTGGNISRTLDAALKDPRRMQQLLQRYSPGSTGGKSDVLNAVRSLALNKMVDDRGFLDSLNDVTKRNELTKLFAGTETIKDLEAVLKAAPMLANQLNTIHNASAGAQSGLEQAMGITVPSLLSRVMDRISGPVTKAANIGRTVAINKANEAYGTKIDELLLSPDSLSSLSAAIARAKTANGEVDADKVLKGLMQDQKFVGRLKAAGKWVLKQAQSSAEAAVVPTARTVASPQVLAPVSEEQGEQIPVRTQQELEQREGGTQ
jgi:hypothetical protein